MRDELETVKPNEQVSEPVSEVEPVPEVEPEPEVESVPRDSCQDDDIEPLSGKPCFPITLLRSHVGEVGHMYQLRLPAQINPMLPNNTVPVTLTRGGRSWETTCSGLGKVRKFDSRWRVFVEDNKLKVGDVCFFEQMECSDTALKFKVQILRGDFPSVLLDKENGTMKNPIVVD